MGGAASSSAGTSSLNELSAELLRPRRKPRQNVVNMRKVEKLIRRKKIAPFYPPTDNEEDDECPICCTNFPAFNYYGCCSKPICTECYVHLISATSELEVPCPYCKSAKNSIKFRVQPPEERKRRRAEEAAVRSAQAQAIERESVERDWAAAMRRDSRECAQASQNANSACEAPEAQRRAAVAAGARDADHVLRAASGVTTLDVQTSPRNAGAREATMPADADAQVPQPEQQRPRPPLGELIDGSYLPPEMLDVWDGRDIDDLNAMTLDAALAQSMFDVEPSAPLVPNPHSQSAFELAMPAQQSPAMPPPGVVAWPDTRLSHIAWRGAPPSRTPDQLPRTPTHLRDAHGSAHNDNAVPGNVHVPTPRPGAFTGLPAHVQRPRSAHDAQHSSTPPRCTSPAAQQRGCHCRHGSAPAQQAGSASGNVAESWGAVALHSPYEALQWQQPRSTPPLPVPAHLSPRSRRNTGAPPARGKQRAISDGACTSKGTSSDAESAALCAPVPADASMGTWFQALGSTESTQDQGPVVQRSQPSMSGPASCNRGAGFADAPTQQQAGGGSSGYGVPSTEAEEAELLRIALAVSQADADAARQAQAGPSVSADGEVAAGANSLDGGLAAEGVILRASDPAEASSADGSSRQTAASHTSLAAHYAGAAAAGSLLRSRPGATARTVTNGAVGTVQEAHSPEAAPQARGDELRHSPGSAAAAAMSTLRAASAQVTNRLSDLFGMGAGARSSAHGSAAECAAQGDDSDGGTSILADADVDLICPQMHTSEALASSSREGSVIGVAAHSESSKRSAAAQKPYTNAQCGPIASSGPASALVQGPRALTPPLAACAQDHTRAPAAKRGAIDSAAACAQRAKASHTHSAPAPRDAVHSDTTTYHAPANAATRAWDFLTFRQPSADGLLPAATPRAPAACAPHADSDTVPAAQTQLRRSARAAAVCEHACSSSDASSEGSMPCPALLPLMAPCDGQHEPPQPACFEPAALSLQLHQPAARPVAEANTSTSHSHSSARHAASPPRPASANTSSATAQARRQADEAAVAEAAAGVLVVQPDGSPCIGWLEAHPLVATLSDTAKRALVTLSYTHARDADLQLTIASDDARMVAAISHGCGASESSPGHETVPALLEHQAAETGSESPTAAPRSSVAAAPADGAGDWLQRMRDRDAALQARIAGTDASVLRAYS